MGSSAKKKREKQKDFQKPKLKVGKTRPKNTNATDTSFSAKSVILRQQNLSETGRDAGALFSHNLSLLSSKNDAQRRDALAYLTTAAATFGPDLPQPPSVLIAKAQPLILDGSRGVREQLLKLLRVLPPGEIGSVEQLLLYTRAGMSHLSTDIRSSSLDLMDWLLESNREALLSCPGGWTKTLRTFQNLFSWHGSTSATVLSTNGKWSASKPTTSLGNNKLLVHQLTTLSTFLTAGLFQPSVDPHAAARQAAENFPLWHTQAHMVSQKSNPFGYLNLFGAPRDVEGEVYLTAGERADVFRESDVGTAFAAGVNEVKKEGGEVGRAAALVAKSLKLADSG